jgi:hypothetical protein
MPCRMPIPNSIRKLRRRRLVLHAAAFAIGKSWPGTDERRQLVYALERAALRFAEVAWVESRLRAFSNKVARAGKGAR